MNMEELKNYANEVVLERKEIIVKEKEEVYLEAIRLSKKILDIFKLSSFDKAKIGTIIISNYNGSDSNYYLKVCCKYQTEGSGYISVNKFKEWYSELVSEETLDLLSSFESEEFNHEVLLKIQEIFLKELNSGFEIPTFDENRKNVQYTLCIMINDEEEE